ncbi:MAG: hypothetical protein PGN13_04140 [Patulibacter minatonensis]
MLVLPEAARASTASAAVEATPVRAFGRAGSFGGLTGATTTPTGEGFRAIGVHGWGFQPGQAAYFPTVAPDGTVVIAGEPQTDNQLLPTSRQMVLSTFDATTLRFGNVIVPTSTGRTVSVGPWASPSGLVGGGDVSDVGVIRVGGESRVAFTSAMPFWGWHAPSGGEYPTLGMLRRGTTGRWVSDTRSSITASELAAGSARAARGARRHRSARARRAARQAAGACITRSYDATGQYGDCRMPAEFDQLPASGALAVTQYALDDLLRPSGRISVLDPRGRVLASYALPRITLADGASLAVHPREVVADPLGRARDERFTIVFDTERGVGAAGEPSTPGAIQEFRYDAVAGTITPTSAPVLSGDASGTGATLGFETARYSADGSLWVGQSVPSTLQAGPVVVYRRGAAARGVLGTRPACAVPDGWSGGEWGRTCPPDERIAAAAELGVARSLDEDPRTRTMYLTTMGGAVLPIRSASDGSHVAGQPIDLGLDRLVDRSVLRIGPRKAALDAARHVLWIPIQQLATAQTCSAWPCAPVTLDQWLYAVDLDRVGQR